MSVGLRWRVGSVPSIRWLLLFSVSVLYPFRVCVILSKEHYVYSYRRFRRVLYGVSTDSGHKRSVKNMRWVSKGKVYSKWSVPSIQKSFIVTNRYITPVKRILKKNTKSCENPVITTLFHLGYSRSLPVQLVNKGLPLKLLW